MPDFKPLPGRDDIYDRGPDKPEYERIYVRESVMSQGAEINELITRQDQKRTRVGNLVAQDGDRVRGCEIITDDIVAGDYTLSSGQVYLRGDVRDVEGASLTGVSVVGDVYIGVRIVEEVIDHEDDPDLLGLHPGTLAEGEGGAVRLKYNLEWGWSGDGEEGALYAVYSLRDGYVTDQSPPPSLTGINQQIAKYDYGAHENYIDEGCVVAAIGKTGTDQIFSIGEGIANILGFKRERYSATRYAETESPDIETIAAEPHTYVDDGGSAVITLNHPPLNGLNSIIIEKEHTETIVRGGVANTDDLLSKTGVTSIVLVEQGETTYTETTDYILSGDSVDWSPGGIEPSGASSYDVTYNYLVAVTPDSITDTAITVSGGIDGGQVIVNYSFKLPRVDRICLDQDGNIAYLKGISTREQPQPPMTPKFLLSLCEVHNDWFGTPTIINNGTRNMPYWQIWRMYNRLVDAVDLIALQRLTHDISSREPNAKHRVFVDPFRDDRYRDAGEAQDAAVFDETCQIAIDPDFKPLNRATVTFLDFTEEVIIRQDLSTNCNKINPYQVFDTLPLSLVLTPSEDFWEETNATWLSPITRVFGQGSQSRVTSQTVLENIQTREAVFLRQIPIAFEVGNLGEGETVDILTFEGIDVDPGGLVGNASGIASGNFNIPANVTTGIKDVYVEGASGGNANARFEGRGLITDIDRQSITEIRRWNQPQPRPIGGGGDDPLAQTFMLNENRHITSLDVKFCVVGDTSNPVVCEIVTVENGIPTVNRIAQAEIDMATVIVGNWQKFSFPVPVFIPAGVEYAFVIKTNDADHSVHIARRGSYDAAAEKWVGAQPYTVGVLLSSSNARTWTPHQDEDLTMRVYGAVFDPVQKVVDCGTIAVTNMSDIIVTSNVTLPTDQTRIRFRITPDGEPSILIEPGQNFERSSYFTGNVLIEAILDGAAKVSPILGRNILAIPGAMRTSGTYISEGFDMGTAIRQDIRLKTNIPNGATLTVEIDKHDDTWVSVALAESEILTNGDIDRRYTEDPWTAALGGRVKITLTGTPAARPAVSDLRAYSI